jgi:AraC-like DNA-binding protein
VIACRDWARLKSLAGESMLDAVVVEVRRENRRPLVQWIKDYPFVPIFGFSVLRPDDGPIIRDFWSAGAVDVIASKVEQAIAGELVASRTMINVIRHELGDAPRLLRLTEPVQLRVWREVIERVDQELRTVTIAKEFGMSREHLSREFAAGDAPNLKRLIDLVKVAVAARMLANPGYTPPMVTRILGFATSSHLTTCVKRVAGVKTAELPELGPRGVLNRFRRGRMRSRL